MLPRPSPMGLALFAAAIASPIAAQDEKSHDVLAHARHAAQHENQRVLLYLTGGEHDAALTAALAKAGRTLRYECQLVAVPADSLPGRATVRTLGLGDVGAPALAVLDAADDRVLESMSGEALFGTTGRVDASRVTELLERHACEHLDARKVLADGLAEAKGSNRHALVYLSAPW